MCRSNHFIEYRPTLRCSVTNSGSRETESVIPPLWGPKQALQAVPGKLCCEQRNGQMRTTIIASLVTLSLALSGCTQQGAESESTQITAKENSQEVAEDNVDAESDAGEIESAPDLEESDTETQREDTTEDPGASVEEFELPENGQETAEPGQSEESKNTVDANKPLSLDNLVPGKTHVKAWESVERGRLSKSSYVPEIKFHISPKLQSERPDRVAIEKAALESASTLWSDSFRPENVQVIYVSNDDPDEKQWFGETVEDLGGLNYMLDWSSFYDSECGARLVRGARASYFEGLYTMVACIAGPASTRALHNQPHEYTHFYQSSNNNIPDNGPPWLVEGGATFYGMALAFKNQTDREESRYLFYRNMTYGFDEKAGNSRGDYIDRSGSWNTEDFVSMMTKLETNRTSHDAATLYLFGSLASEALVAAFGHQAMEQFHESFNSTLNWKSSFQQIFGISTAAFYEKLLPYVKSELEIAGKTQGL